jgi:hypothetical protein
MSKKIFFVIGIFLMGIAVIYLSFRITSQQSETAPVSVKVKAQGKTYSKYITFDQENNLTATITPTLTVKPSPTEIVIAKTTSTPAASPSSSLVSGKATSSPKITQLPNSGVIEWSLAFFTISFLLIIAAFVF